MDIKSGMLKLEMESWADVHLDIIWICFWGLIEMD